MVYIDLYIYIYIYLFNLYIYVRVYIKFCKKIYRLLLYMFLNATPKSFK